MEINFIVTFRNLLIALLIWCAIWFFKGFFGRIIKVLREGSHKNGN